MSKIKEIIAEYPEEHNPIVSVALLSALDVLADELARIADALAYKNETWKPSG